MFDGLAAVVVVVVVVEYCCRGRGGEMDDRLKLVELHPPTFVVFENGVASGWMMAYYIILQVYFFNCDLSLSCSSFIILSDATNLSNKFLNDGYVCMYDRSNSYNDSSAK